MLIERFEGTVDTFPERIAIKMEVETFTYRQLNQYANQVAARIIASTGLCNKGKQAALLFEHGADMIIGLIAALKANMVYVPLDHTYPENRLAYMLEDSQAALILTNTNNLPLARRLARKIKGKIQIMDLRETGAGQLEGNVERTVSEEAPAYILYTSGSTGRPKGVIQNHDNVLYYTRNWIQRFSITPGDRMTLLTAFSHDGFVQDLWSALLSGAALFPYDVKNVLERTPLSEFIKNEKITIWHSVPTLFRYFTDSLIPGEIFPHPRFILLGGEPLRKHDIEIFKRYFPNAVLANVYGQTESSVSSIAFYTQEDVFGLPILGEPLDKTEILLVTEEGEILEDMGTGEIVIACHHLAPGYWQDDESTREKFSHDPELGKLYWTGDLGRLKGNREITIIGRKDLQIKIRGFRVEVGEIETVLLRHEAVKQAAVILKETKENEPYLCCYFTSTEPIDAARLREYLLHQVPDYMIPGTFMQLEHLPLTPSGKVDGNALPEPAAEEMEKEYKPPVTEVERQLAEIWQEVLNLKPKHQPIGIEDNFFELGGHSLKAIRLIARVHKVFQVKLELEEVFSFPGLRELAHLIDGKSRETFRAIHPVEKKEYHPLSSTQKRLYFLQQMEPEGTGYNLSDIMELEEEIDIKKVEQTFQKLVQRHESLRTSFHMIDDQPGQKVHTPGKIDFAIEYYDLITGDTGEKNYKLQNTNYKQEKVPFGQINACGGGEGKSAADIISSFVRPFDLERAPLFKVGVIRFDENKHIFMMDMHHIISDGTSQEIFSEDFKRLYEDSELVCLKLQYKDYAQWQRGEIDRGVLRREETYWLKEFTGDIPVLELPIDYPRPLIQSFEGDVIRFALEKDVSQGLKRLARQEEVTLYMVLLAVVNVLLFKLSSQEDIVVGTPVGGRRHTDLEEIIGMFVNTLTLRNYLPGEKTFSRLLKEIKDKTMKAFENQEYPFEELVERAAVHRDMSRNPLFDVMFALHNQSTLPPEMLKVMRKGRYANIPFRHNRSKFDLTLHAIEAGEILGVSIEYCSKLFKKETILGFFRYFRAIIASISENHYRKLSDINILSKEEIRQLLVEFNQTRAQYPRHQTLHQLFARQVEQTPDSTALVGKEEGWKGRRIEVKSQEIIAITYKELNRTSNQLAHLLREKGGKRGSVVGLMVKRSLEMVPGLLGIIKAGGAYFPIDPQYPAERKKYMLKDSRVNLVLTNLEKQSLSAFIPPGTGIIAIPPGNLYPGETGSPANLNQAADLVYVIYTSGSTGKPKGVTIEHGNVVNLMEFNLQFTGMDFAKVLQYHSISFDASFNEIFCTLLPGGTLYIPGNEIRDDICELLKYAAKSEIKTLFLPMSLLTVIFNDQNLVKLIPHSLKHIQTAGEQVVISKRFKEFLQKRKVNLHNHYGPSETHVVTALQIDPAKEIPTVPTIGKPILNTQIYILDKENHLLPVGVPGEISIGGNQVGRGYLNRPGLTAEKFVRAVISHSSLVISSSKKLSKSTNDRSSKFIPNDCSPYRSNTPLPQSPIYRTGDLARWLPDGYIEFLGRIDTQIKIRGFRIEPGEIENQLLNYKDISGAVVISPEDKVGDKHLCAYIVSDKEISIPPLKKYLSRLLPDYMIPTYVIQVERIPLTVHGKVDGKELPKPVIQKSAVHQAPGDWWEEQIAVLWAEVLGVAKEMLSIDTNFFEIGGHSLKATILVSKIHKTFNVKLPLVEVFKQPSIRGQAPYIKNAVKDKFIPITPVEKQEYYDLSSAQKRLYILQQLEPGSTSYNMPQTISLADETDIKKLERAFIKLIERHESLRTSFFQIDEKPVQKVHDKVEFSIEYYKKKEVEVKVEEKKEPFGQINAFGGERGSETIEGTRGKRQKTEKRPSTYLSSVIRHQSSEFVRPFDLREAPLLRVGLIELPHTPTALRGPPSQTGKERKYILMIDMHHIITDGTSQNLLKKEFIALFQGEVFPPLAPLRLQYKDFSGWQNSEKQRQLLKQQEFYWIKAFSDELPALNLPTDYPRPLMQSFEGNSLNFVLNEKETRTLKNIARENKATLFMVVLSVFAILLSKLSGQEDIIVGTPIAARRHADLENIIGMFVNTLAMRNYPTSEEKFNQFLKEVKRRTLEVFENQEYQFEDLVDRLSPRRDTGRNPIFDVMFNLLNQSDYTSPIQDLDDPYENEPAAYHHRKGTSKFDLYLAAVDMGKRLFFNLEYCTRLFKPGTIERIIGYFKKIVSSLSDRDISWMKLSEMDIVPEEEKARILDMSKGIREIYDTDTCIHRLFEAQVDRSPDQIALVGVHETHKKHEKKYNMSYLSYMSYRELNKKSNQLAQLLREKGVKPDTVVGLMMERSIEMISGILAVMKAGGAYMPIDTEYPAPRKKYMLQDSQITLLLTNCEPDRASGFIPANTEIIDISVESIYQGNGVNLLKINKGSDLLYVIYTSGSTGNPKGVMLEHRNLLNLLRFQFKYTNIDCTGILQFTPISFDVSFQEIFSALLAGGVLYLINRETRTNIPGLFDVIRKNIIKTLFLPMSFLKLIFKEEEYISLIPGCIEHIVTAGEQVIVSNTFRDYLKSSYIYLHNHYGPSETHVVTTLTLDPQEEIPGRPFIGKPILNTSVYILDKGKYLVPPGVPGELYIGGAQVGRGYWDRPGLTAEKFDHDLWDYQDYHDKKNKSFLGGPGGRFFKKVPLAAGGNLYKTGDLARWLPEGNIEFLGRIDTQVKIRGFRIEPGEIEHQLINHKDITEAVVISQEDGLGDKHLCVYIVSDKEISIPPLKEYLSHSLPDYMIPSFVIQVEKIPLTVHGKINRQALPKPVIEKPTVFVSPRDWWEEQMVVLWAEVLGVDKEMLSIDTNFFEIGGQSLKATILTTKIHKALKVKIPLAAVFKTPFIRGLAGYIKKTAPNQGFTVIEPSESKEYYALSPTQKGIYILQRLDPSGTAYHIPHFLEIKGTADKQRFEEAFRALIKRHGSLRTSFDMVNGEPVQKIHPKVKFEIEYYDLKVAGALIHGDGRRWENEGTRGLAPLSLEPFDLSVPPLFRVGMIRLQEKKHVLMVDIHHIVSDGTSISILVRDFLALYQGTELLPQAIQYKDYSQWQNSRQRREITAKQEMVWLKEFEGELPLLNLPLDFPRPPVQEFAGSALAFELNPQETQAVKDFVLKERVTIYMMILSVFTLLMAKLSGQEDIIVGTPAAGRNHENLQSIVGMFVNTLALRNFPLFYKTFKEFLHSVKEKTLTAFENQDFAFEELVDRLSKGIPRDKGRNPIFDVMVTPRDIEVTAVEIPGLKLGPYTRGKNSPQTTKFDLTLIETETPDQLFFTLSYRTRLFKEETIRRFIHYFKKIFAAVVENPQKRIGEIDIITGKERRQILEEFNDTRVEYPADKTLHQLFAEQAARTPGHIALAGTHQTLKKHEKKYNMSYLSYMSYKELNKKSNQLALLLQEKGVQPDTIVSIMMERSLDMIIGIMGILKAGAAYLPIDPGYPPERINYMLKDSSAKVLIITSTLAKEVKKLRSLEVKRNLEIIFIDSIEFSVFSSSHLLNFSTSHSSNLAYIIYTSGSTGKPKGVPVRHRGAVNVVTWFARYYHIDDYFRVLQLSSYTFDASVNQVFGTLSRGAGLYLVSKELLENFEKLRAYIRTNEINMIYYVPLFLKELLLEHNRIKSLKVVISGGDLLEQTIKDKFLEKGYTLYNQYGPTETTVNVFAGQCSQGKVALGRPISNTVCLILDRANHLCPVGITGELCLTGAGVSRGYLNRPERTAEKFDHDLWDYLDYQDGYHRSYRSYKSYIYRTGDLARWFSDGRVEFLGRMDHQVKIRGFRVELGEIESHLHRINGVKNAVVIAREGQTNEKYLCAYIVAEEAVTMSHLEDELAKRLPSYMIPAFFVPLQEIPMTVIGKLDRKALPEPVFQLKKNKFYAPPRTYIEKKLLDIWLKVLWGKIGQDESLGIDDSFFELGGNSIKAIRLISEIYKTFNVELPMGLIFKAPFIRSISAHLMRHTFTVTEEEIVVSLSPGKTGGEKIFCFPPAVGYGIAYMAMVPWLDNYSLYGFNYIESEDKDRDKMEKYVDTIIEIQPRGPYTLLGYSAGGRLCINAAELLEKRGNQVKDIILLDCYSQRKSLPDDVAQKRSREFNLQLKQGLKELGLEPLTDRVMDTIEKYAQYHDALQELEPAALCANIHLIKAKDKQGQEGFIGWEAFTRGEYHEYEGFGIHKEFLYADFIEQNAAVINSILTSVPHDKKLLQGVLKHEGWKGKRVEGEKIRSSKTRLKGSKPCASANSHELYNNRYFDAFAAGSVHLKKPSVGPKGLIGPPCHGAPGRRRQWQAQETLSAYNVKFLEFVRRNSEALIGANYREMIEKLGGDVLQPWPTFIDQAARRIMEKTALTTINLIRCIPKRIFNNEPYLMSRYYQLPVNMIETQLNGVTDEFLDTLIGRGDFLLTASGYKCLEFNIAANIGGLYLPFWAVPYFENPIILRFLKESQIKIKGRDVINVLLDYLVFRAEETLTITDNRLNIAMVAPDKGGAPGESNDPGELETALNRKYEKTLGQLDRKLQGKVILCDFDDLTVRGDGLYHKDQPVHVLVEFCEGTVPPGIFHLFKIRRICLFNGPVTGLMSNKLNLALLSEHEDSPLFNEMEREAIKTYIPWTRKILPLETLYKSEKIQLIDFIRRNRDQLVMKPAVGHGGEGVAVGKYISQHQWETVLETALQKGKWLVQEYVPSLPLLYQYGENGAKTHIGVMGFLVFGNRFGGGYIRMLPCSKRRGVINVHQGARVSILFEVEGKTKEL